MQQKRLRFRTLLLCLLLPLIGQLQAQTIDLGDFANPSSHFNQSIGQTAPFDFDYLSSVTQQIYTATELQGIEGKEITKLAFQIYLSEGESYNTEYTNDLQIYLTNVSNDHFESVAGKYHWLPINAEQDLYMKKTITLDLLDLTINGNHETSKAGVAYHTLELELDKPFVYTGQSILLSVRSKASKSAVNGPGRSNIEFCSYPKNVKEMPVRTINKATDKAISEGFVGVLGETADRGQKDRAVMRITFRDASTPKPSYDPIHPVVQLTEAGSLAKLMKGMDLLKCQSITVSGPMNAEDCKTIRDNMGNLTEINIADATFTEDQLPEAAFYNMPLVRKVTLPHTLKVVGERALAQMYKLEEVVLGTQVTKICDSAFAQNRSLTKLSPMPALITIGKYAFKECTALTAFPWPETLTTLDTESFSGSGLTEVRLPNVAVVPNTCFFSCKALTKVYLGAKTTEVMFGAFAYCKALTDITVEAVQPPKSHIKAFNGLKPANINLFVPNNAQEAYKAANVWKGFHIVPIPGTEPQIKKYLLTYRVIGEHGTLKATTATGTVIDSQTEVEEHTAITFTADPKLDYVVKSFKINGTETPMTAGKQNVQTYTYNIEAATEVTVEFVHRPYTVTYSVRDGVGGTITATYKGQELVSGATTPAGESATIIFTAHPEEHYHVKKWVVNGLEGPKPAENNQWQVISGKDYVVEVIFERDKVYYMVDVSQVGNGGPIYLEVGGVRRALKSKVPENMDIRVYVEPDEGYRLDYWMVNRERINPVDGSLEYMTKATKDLRIVAYYAKEEKNNAIDAPTAGTADVAIALEGQKITLTSNTGSALGTVALYDYSGRLIEQRVVADKLCTLTAPQAGVYLLSIGTTTAKVLVQ